MWKHTISLLILVLFSVGCTVSSNTAPTKAIPQETENIFTPSNPARALSPTPTDSSFSEIDRGHINQQFFSKTPDFQLLVKNSENRMGSLNLSRMDIQDEQLLSDSIVAYPVVSDDGVSVAQIIRQGDDKLLMVKNFITDKESSITLPVEAVLPHWLEDNQLAIWGGVGHAQCLELLLIYDVSTNQAAFPNHRVSNLQKSQCIQLPFLTADGIKMIYPWKMFDTTTGKSTDVLPFMTRFPEYPSVYALNEVDEKVSLAYINENKLYYLLNIPLDKLTNVDLKPEVTILPELGSRGTWSQPLGWNDGQQQIAVDLLDGNIDPQKMLVSGQQVPTRFYLVDFAAHKIINYDLDRAVFEDGSLPEIARDGFFSPDAKYFAWTVYDSSSGLPIGSKILDLSAGTIVSAPNIEVLGWTASKTK